MINVVENKSVQEKDVLVAPSLFPEEIQTEWRISCLCMGTRK